MFEYAACSFYARRYVKKKKQKNTYMRMEIFARYFMGPILGDLKRGSGVSGCMESGDVPRGDMNTLATATGCAQPPGLEDSFPLSSCTPGVCCRCQPKGSSGPPPLQ